MTTTLTIARCPQCNGHDKFTVHVRHNGLNVCQSCREDSVSSILPTVENPSGSSRRVLREGASSHGIWASHSASSRRSFTRVT